MSKSIYQQTREVYNKLGKVYIKDSRNFAPIERPTFRKAFFKGARILDVGCGGGWDAKFFSASGLRVTGIDASDVFIREARKAAPKANFIQGDLLKISFPMNTFDGIWAQAVLHHLKRKDVPKALRKFHKILKPGGLMHVRVKKGIGEKYEKEKLSGWNERFYTYFSKKEMERIMRKEGFKIPYSGIFPDKLNRKGVTWIAIWAKK